MLRLRDGFGHNVGRASRRSEVDRMTEAIPPARATARTATVVLLGTLDTKGEEYAYLANRCVRPGARSS